MNADKPDSVKLATDRSVNVAPWNGNDDEVEVLIEFRGPHDGLGHFEIVTPDEARQIAHALEKAADAAEAIL